MTGTAFMSVRGAVESVRRNGQDRHGAAGRHAVAVLHHGQRIGLGHDRQLVGLLAVEGSYPPGAVIADGQYRPDIMGLAVRLATDGAVDRRRNGQVVELAVPAHLTAGRPHEQLETDHGRHRVAREPEHRNSGSSEDAEGERFGWSDRHLHPTHRSTASFPQDGLDDIGISDADPTTGQ